jgi:hypothetical protein
VSSQNLDGGQFFLARRKPKGVWIDDYYGGYRRPPRPVAAFEVANCDLKIWNFS